MATVDCSTTLAITMIDSAGNKTTKRFTGIPYSSVDLGLKSVGLTYIALTNSVANTGTRVNNTPIDLSGS